MPGDRGYCFGTNAESRCHKNCPVKELEKKLNKAILHWSNYGDMATLIRDDNTRRLNELKEHSKGVLNSAIEGDRRIIEVLWELKPILLNHFEKDKIEGRLALQDLFKKLDSGDEKDWFNNGWCAPYWKAFKQHSKPPEHAELVSDGTFNSAFPKMTDDEIMRFNEEIMAKAHKREVQPLRTSGGETIIPNITQNRELCMKVSKPPEPLEYICDKCKFSNENDAKKPCSEVVGFCHKNDKFEPSGGK